MKIPVKYNGLDIGQVIEFNKDTGKTVIQLDMNKKQAIFVKELIINDCPISFSCKNEPSKKEK
jgi:hypothetical protein